MRVKMEKVKLEEIFKSFTEENEKSEFLTIISIERQQRDLLP